MSHYLHLRGASQPVEFVTPDIIPFNAFYEKVTHSDIKFRQDYDALLSFSRELNENLQAKKIKEAHRGLLICGILVALENAAFKRSFRV
jgi:type I restriction enzyme M protein